MRGAYVDPYLAARQLPPRPVDNRSWRGHRVVTHARQGVPHRYDRLTYAWAATQAAGSDEVEFDVREVKNATRWPGSLADVAQSFYRLAHSFVELALPGACGTTANFSLLTTFERFNLSKRTGRGEIRFGSLFHRKALIPVDADAIRSLARHSFPTLDQYLWQVTTAWLRHDEMPFSVPLDTMRTELACPIQDDSAARYRLKQRQDTIRKHCPGCPHDIQGDEFVLRPGEFDDA